MSAGQPSKISGERRSGAVREWVLRLPTIRDRFDEIAAAAQREQLSYLGFLADCVAECDDRATPLPPAASTTPASPATSASRSSTSTPTPRSTPP